MKTKSKKKIGNLILIIISIFLWFSSIALIMAEILIGGIVLNIICIELFINLEIKRREIKNEKTKM